MKASIHYCACGTLQPYALCCGRFIESKEFPPTPEALMRSRYTAFTQANTAYLAATMQAPAALNFNANYIRAWAKKVQWIKLEVLQHSQDGTLGWVEFRAYFFEDGHVQALHELSEFHLIDGHWFYVDGKNQADKPAIRLQQPNRNDPCACGSGKKYKKCCG